MKKLVLILTIAIGAMSSNASYLYWQVSGNISEDTQTWEGVGYDLARITYTTGSAMNEYQPYETAGITIYDAQGNVTSYNGGTGPFLASAEFNSGYSYYIELYNGSQLVSRSAGITGEELSSGNYLYNSAAEVTSILNPSPSVNIWHAAGSGYTAVPEPTSALLMMFGMAFLGLKRKNRSIA